MAVQAQYPANVLLLIKRAEPEINDKEIDQSPVFFSSNGGNANLRKRGRESHPAPPETMGLRAPPLVSTGLRLAFDEPNRRSFFPVELAAQINQQKEEIEQFLLAQGEQLQKAIAESQQRHYRTLLTAAAESAGRRLMEKEAEFDREKRRSAELEDRLAYLRSESMAWQARAIAEQAAASSLYFQIQKAAAAAAAVPAVEEYVGESPAADEESANMDSGPAEAPARDCRSCRRRIASVIVIPCRHLCLCSDCGSAGAGEGCPVCGCLRTGSVEVFLS